MLPLATLQTIENRYGELGRYELSDLYEKVSEENCSITYDAPSWTFTIINSKNLGKETINSIFQKNIFNTRAPSRQETTDSNGNIQFKFYVNTHKTGGWKTNASGKGFVFDPFV